MDKEAVTLEKNFSEEKFDFKKIYLYTSKPKLVIWLKKLIGLLVIVSLLLFFINNTVGFFITKTSGKSFGDNFYGKNILTSIRYLFPFISLFMIYYAFRKEFYDREKYQFSLAYSVLMIGYHTFWVYISWNNLNKTAAEISGGFDEVWKVFNIISIVFNFFIIFLFIFINLIKPKIDQQKLIKFQTEMRKKMLAKMKNEDYQMDLTDLE